MLKTAVHAKIPLIRTETRDPLHFDDVLADLIGDTIRKIPRSGKALTPVWKVIGKNEVVWWHQPPDNVVWAEVHEHCEKLRTTMIVTGAEPDPHFFEVAEPQPSDSLIEDALSEYGKGPGEDLVRSMRGLTLKELHETVGLATAKYKELSPASVAKIRRELHTLPSGLQLVGPLNEFYAPDKSLDDWLKLDGRLLIGGAPKSLRPRGLLFAGPPGTGKTVGAKYLAQQLHVPMYYLNVPGLLQKYVGESERNLGAALDQLEKLEPCILLLDEVEKIFISGSEDAGVTNHILSSLLWWLQEHDLKVFTIMTSNHTEGIPPELIRPGRIDATCHFDGVPAVHIDAFTTAVAKSYSPLVTFTKTELDKLKERVRESADAKSYVPQAQIVQRVRDEAKRKLVFKKGVKR